MLRTCIALTALVVGLASLSSRGVASVTPAADLISRGYYLTHGAGRCGDCHGATFAGGPNVIPGPPGAPWAKTVPDLRGLPMFASDAAAVSFLTTAKLGDGSTALGPMPHYQFDEADATAIVAYFRSLK
jgi:mono/diheme cytochrome c family protein